MSQNLVTVPPVPARPAHRRLASAAGRAYRAFTDLPLMSRLALVVLIAICLSAVFAPWLAPYSPYKQHAGRSLEGPSRDFLLGTDLTGRDVLSRLLYAGRISLIVALVAVSVGGFIGSSIGVVSSYAGGMLDALTMRAVDVVLAFPAVIVGIVVVAARGPGVANVAVAIALVNMPIFARLARVSVLRAKEMDYVAAAHSLGTSHAQILRRHIVPMIIGPLLVQAGIAITAAILLESGLAYLGLGAQPPTPSWGGMLADAQSYIRVSPTYGIFPGALLTIVLYRISTLVDTVRDSRDPAGKSRI